MSFPLAPGHRTVVERQAPPGIEGLAEDARLVPGKDRLEAELRGDGVDADRPFEQRPRADWIGGETDAVARVPGPEVPWTVPARRFGMRLDEHGHPRVFFLREDQHLAEPVAIRTACGDRGIAAGLVDNQHVSRLGRLG